MHFTSSANKFNLLFYCSLEVTYILLRNTQSIDIKFRADIYETPTRFMVIRTDELVPAAARDGYRPPLDLVELY